MSGALQASASIESLPDELLLGIAREAQFGPLRICAVCQRWRRIGHNNRSLWTHIKLDDTHADMSRDRALYFADLAGNLPLEILRPGYPFTHDKDDTSRALSDVLDDLVLALVPRCKSYVCCWMTADARRVAFIKALLRIRCENLQQLELGSHRPIEVMYGDAEALPVIADQFPHLSSLTLSDVCLPLSRMLASSHCSAVTMHHEFGVDDIDCQHGYAFGLEVKRIVDAIPTLRTLKAELYGDFLHDLEELATDRLELHSILVTLSSTLEELFIAQIPTTWPSLNQLEQLSLVHLRELWLTGTLVQPRVYVQDGDPESDFTYTIDPFLQLLAATPNLMVLNVREWFWLPDLTQPIATPTICLSRLEEVHFLEVHEHYVGQILSRLKMPRLRKLDLSTLFRSAATAFMFMDVMNAWDLPYLEEYALSSSEEEGNTGDPTYPALALGRMLRDGNLPRLQNLEVTTPGWVTETDLRDAIEAIRDPSVVPSLVELQISNSTPPVDPSWVEAVAQERNAHMGYDAALPRLSVTVLSGDLFDDSDSNGREVEEDTDSDSDSDSESEENDEAEYASDGYVEMGSTAGSSE